MEGFTQFENNKKINITFLLFFRICILLALVLHLVFSILFFKKGIVFLGWFNIFSCLLYLAVTIYLFLKKEALVFSILVSFLEVHIHMLLCIYFIGWQGGFYVYPLCLIAPIYFVTIIILKKDFLGHLIVFTTFILYQLCKIFADNRIAMYQQSFSDISDIVYKFNTLTACFFIAFLIYGFLYEMRTIQETLKNKNKILNNLANIDVLTGLNNRRSMDLVIKNEIKHFENTNKNFCVAICDIDNFKNINDTYGHDCGDLIIKGIADILTNSKQKYDVEVCRWGGEEFLILIRDDLSKTKDICTEILNNVRNFSLLYNNTNIKVTITIGGSEYNEKNNNIEKVLKNADINLYKGKSSTKDCIVIN